jgi:hypothetical protein
MHACMHTSIHACIHTSQTRKDTYIHTYIHTCMHTYIHLKQDNDTQIHACMHACIHPYMHAYIHLKQERIHTYIHTYIHAYIHLKQDKDTQIHACMHTYMDTYIHRCMHAYIYALENRTSSHYTHHTYIHRSIHTYRAKVTYHIHAPHIHTELESALKQHKELSDSTSRLMSRTDTSPSEQQQLITEMTEMMTVATKVVELRQILGRTDGQETDGQDTQQDGKTNSTLSESESHLKQNGQSMRGQSEPNSTHGKQEAHVPKKDIDEPVRPHSSSESESKGLENRGKTAPQYVHAFIASVDGVISNVPNVHVHVHSDMTRSSTRDQFIWSNFETKAHAQKTASAQHTQLRVICAGKSDPERPYVPGEMKESDRDAILTANQQRQCQDGRSLSLSREGSDSDGRNLSLSLSREGWLGERVAERKEEFGFCDDHSRVYSDFVAVLSLFDDEAVEQVRMYVYMYVYMCVCMYPLCDQCMKNHPPCWYK